MAVWVVGVQAGVGRPNSEEWCQERAGTFTWRHGAGEMGGGVVMKGVGGVHPHPLLAGKHGAWRFALGWT